MWPYEYLKEGYYDEDGIMRREVIVEHALEIANLLGKLGATSNSLRRYYGKVASIRNRLSTGTEFAIVRPKIDELIRDVEYAASRQVVPDTFADFIKINVDLATQSAQNFEGFFQHFQSVIAFSKNTDSQGNRSRQNYRGPRRQK